MTDTTDNTTAAPAFAPNAITKAVRVKIAGENKRIGFALEPAIPAIPASLDTSLNDKGELTDPIAATVWAGFMDSYLGGITLAVEGNRKEGFATEKEARAAMAVSIARGYDWQTWEGFIAFLNETSGRVTIAQRTASLRGWIDSEVEACAEQAAKGTAVSKVYLAALGALSYLAKSPINADAFYSWLAAPVGLNAKGELKSPKQVENLSGELLRDGSSLVVGFANGWREYDSALLTPYADALESALAAHKATGEDDDSDF